MTPKIHFGTFPTFTAEEMLVENRLDYMQIKSGVIALGEKHLDAVISRIKVQLGNEGTEHGAESEFYGVFRGLIQIRSKARKTKVLRQMEELGIFNQIYLNTALALTIKCVRVNDQACFEAITKTPLARNLLRPKLTRCQVGDRDTVGHLAARLDHADILESIARIDPDSLDLETSNCETITHTAFRSSSCECLELLLKTKPEQLKKHNGNGETPQDLAPNLYPIP